MTLRGKFTLCVLAASSTFALLACGAAPRTDVQSAIIGAPNAPTPSWDGDAGVDASSPPQAEPRWSGETVTFARLPWRVGDRFEEHGSNAYAMTMRIGAGGAAPQVVTIDNTERETKQVEVLAVRGDAVTKLRVTYVEKTIVVGLGAAASPAQSQAALAGKTYVVEARDGKTIVLSDRGAVPPADEVTAVTKDHKHLGRPDAIESHLPTRPLHVNEVVPELAQAMLEELSEDKMVPTNVRVTLREKRGDSAVFELTLTLGRDENAMSFSVTLSGQMTLRTGDGRMTSIDVSGPLILGASKSAASLASPPLVDGDGQMELHIRRVYSGRR